MHRIVGCSGLVNKEGKLDLVDAPLFIVLHGKEFSYKIEIRPGVDEEESAGSNLRLLLHLRVESLSMSECLDLGR